MQWNFLPGWASTRPTRGRTCSPTTGRAAAAWSIAVLDTGVAYRNWEQFRKSPDFGGTHFVDPYDFVANNRLPARPRGPRHVRRRHDRRGDQQPARADRAGVRRDDHAGPGARRRAATATRRRSRRGIRYAVKHGAQVINLSLEFDITVTAPRDPRHHQRDPLRPPATGWSSSPRPATTAHGISPIPRPRQDVISVGATTSDRCLADYSNGGTKLDLVAPGGGDDASLPAIPIVIRSATCPRSTR